MVILIHSYLFTVMWLGYLIYWWAMSANVKAIERTEPAQSRLTRLVLMICAIALFALPRALFPLLNSQFLPDRSWYFWVGAALTATGLLFSVWARHYLGKNWSQEVTVKADHELITTGPYSMVRHPIYTGLFLAFLGSAIARGEWRGLLALALVSIALCRKLKLEEEWMLSRFGESYRAYMQRVSALVPYII